jgi:DNA polymerase V
MQTLEAQCPRVERYSIDEAFVEIPGRKQTEREAFARQLRVRVLRDTGIPVSIGLAPTKVLAKLANRQAKRREEAAGIWSMPEDPENRQQQLSVTSLTDVWGISRRWARRLETEGWQNAADLAAADPAMIRLVTNVVLQRIALELRGESCLSLEETSPPPRSLVRSRSFGQPLYQLTELRPALGRYLQRGWEHLRRHHLRASGIQVFLHTSRFHREVCYFGSRQAVIEPTDDLWELQRCAFALLQQAYRSGVAYTRCGIMLFGLEPDQPSWNMDTAWQPRAELQQAITGLQQRWGRDVLQLAHTLTATKGLPLQQHRSPRYTTRWSELAIVGKNIFLR